MLFLISPAKTLDYSESPTDQYTQSRLKGDTSELVGILREKGPDELGKLMKINQDLALENANRYRAFKPKSYSKKNSKQALLAFKGHVYQGLNAADFKDEDLAFAQDHLRILSGLYGVLRPLDLMQPYRLEMGTRLENARGKDLYTFWDDKITRIINKDLKAQGDKTVINLASKEYFKAIRPEKLKGEIIDVAFKEYRDGTYKIVSVYAKMARGMMVHYAVKNQIDSIEGLKGFDYEGYTFQEELSGENELVFVR
jgi:cytoplasmic iron level regulating protein YaaA (DUF328/UPF0246 family)